MNGSGIPTNGGQTLPFAMQLRMERFFGRNFDAVRVHSDSRAHSLAQSLNARAFTMGQSVFFGRGQYQPDSAEGQRLIAHELTHTIQQRNGNSAVAMSARHSVDAQNSALEREANAAAHAFGAGSSVLPNGMLSAATPALIQREPVNQAGDTEAQAELIYADRLSDAEYSALTGLPANTLPDGQVMDDLARLGSVVHDAPAETLPPGVAPELTESTGSELGGAALGAALATPSPISLVPANSTGIMWVQGHLSIFAKVEGQLTIRGFRGNLGWYTGEMLPRLLGGEWFSGKLNTGVPGSFANDTVFTKMPGEQTVIYVPTDAETAAEFRDELKATEYNETYKYSAPSPDAKPGGREARMREKLVSKGGEAMAVQCGNQCTTVPVSQMEKATGTRPAVDTAKGRLDITTGQTDGGPVDPVEKGRAKRMREYMKNPDLSAAKPGAGRSGMTAGATRAMGVVRVGGTIWALYGAKQSITRLYDAWGTEEFAHVAIEEGASWGAGLAGAELGGAISTAIGQSVYLAAGTEITAVFVVGSFGLSLGLGFIAAASAGWLVNRIMAIPDVIANGVQTMRVLAEDAGVVVDASRRFMTDLFVRPIVLAHASIDPTNWDLRRMPPTAAGTVRALGNFGWGMLGVMDVDQLMMSIHKTYAQLGTPPVMAAAAAQAIEASGVPYGADEILAMSPYELVSALNTIGLLRFVRQPDVIADDTVYEEGHKVDEAYLNVHAAPTVALRARINPNNWEVSASTPGALAVTEIGMRVWKNLRNADISQFYQEAQRPLSSHGVTLALMRAAVEAIARPKTFDGTLVAGESVPQEIIDEIAQDLLTATPDDFVSRLVEGKSLRFRQDPSTLGNLAINWMRAGYQAW